MEQLALGVDMAKADFEAAIYQDGKPVEIGSFSNDASGFAALKQQVEQADHTVHLVLEATGGYEMGLVYFAHEADWQVSLPNPKQVREWARGNGWRAKTDRQDAQILAAYAATVQPAAEQPLPPKVRQLDSLVKRRADLEAMLRQERNRFQELPGRPDIAAPVRASLSASITQLAAALEELEAAIKAHLKAHPQLKREVRRLRTIPGVGAKVVLPLLVVLYRFEARTGGTGTAKGITAFVGLDPQPYDSGRSVHKRASISKMSDSEMRRLLYMGALGGKRGDNALRQFYERLVGRGKAKKLALVAAARKILVWAWTLFSRKSEWDAARFHTEAD